MKGEISKNAEQKYDFLIYESWGLLSLLSIIGVSENCRDVEKLANKIINMIHILEQRLEEFRWSNTKIKIVSYCICAAIDEAILSTVWGKKSNWSQHVLLDQLHQENWGGERFFDFVSNLEQRPKKNITLLAFILFILQQGYKGKYYKNQQENLKIVTEKLQQIILLQQPPKQSEVKIKKIRYQPFLTGRKIIVSVALGVLMAMISANCFVMSYAKNSLQGFSNISMVYLK